MRESDTFLAIIEEGRVIQARRLTRRLATRSLPEPDEASLTCLERITGIDRLERIHRRALQANSWQDPLNTP